MTKYKISETIKEIGRLSFARSGLTSIKIPDNVETIGYGAFYACENLKEVTISDEVTTIETKAFADTPWLEQWFNSGNAAGDNESDKASDFLIVGDGILLAYRGAESSIEIPDHVKQIGSEAFKGHEELMEVIHNELMDEGDQEVEFDGANLASGVYFYRIEAGEGVLRGRFVLMK